MKLRSLLQSLKADLRPDTQRGQLVRSAAGTAALKIAATGIAFVASLVYARALGPHGFGLYAYVMAWVAVLTIPSGLGIPSYLVREGAKHPLATGSLRRWADRRVAITGILSGIILVIASLLPSAHEARDLFFMAAPIPLLANLSMVRQSLIQARGWIVRSQWPQLLFAPSVTLVLLGALWLWRNAIHPMDIVVATVVAALAQLAINIKQLGQTASAEKPSTPWAVKEAMPFMWISALHLVVTRVDLILLGSMRSASEAGIYAVASRAAEFVPFFLTAAGVAIAPKVSSLYHQGADAQLQRLASSAARRLLWLTLPLAAILIFAALPLLEAFYGAAYSEGATALKILALAQFFNVLSGPVGTLLNMTHHASASAKAFAFAAAINVLLNLILIPLFGITGAASATATSLILCNIIRWYWVRRHLRIKPSALGI